MKALLPLGTLHCSKSVLRKDILGFDPDAKAYLKVFTPSDKEDFWKIEFTDKANPSAYSMTEGTSLFTVPIDDVELLDGNCVMIIEKMDGIPRELQDIQKMLDFAFRVVLGKDFRISKFVECGMFSGARHNTGQQASSRRKIDRIGIKQFRRISSVAESYSLLIKMDRRVQLLETLLSVAMSLRVAQAGAFYITILESIFTPDHDSELSYRLCMRLAKQKGKGLEMVKLLRDLYRKRSRVFHGGKGKPFTVEDVRYLEELSAWAIEEYLKSPDAFLQEELDTRLLA